MPSSLAPLRGWRLSAFAPRCVFDLKDAESYSCVCRASRWEKPQLGAVHRRPQKKIGEICGLEARPESPLFAKIGRRCELCFRKAVVVVVVVLLQGLAEVQIVSHSRFAAKTDFPAGPLDSIDWES